MVHNRAVHNRHTRRRSA